uniref:Chromosome 1 open reading frame 174 n=1 Tax=Anas platyrhynchos TaxID=8839 RepID=A0A8B9TJV1_ANAPL
SEVYAAALGPVASKRLKICARNCRETNYKQLSSSSRKAADRQPSKRLKCEKNSLVKSELEGRTCGTGNLAVRKAALKTSAEDSHSEDSGDCNTTQQKKDENSLKPFAEKSSSAPSKTESNENLQSHVSSEEESCETVLSDKSSLKDGDIPKKLTELDNSAFLDEDSNQPMPVDRFFGNIDFIQDQPAVALPSTTMSRREFRRLHFIAKEDEEEEEDVL